MLMMFLILAAAQTSPAPASDPYAVDDPFALEAPAPAAPAPVGTPTAPSSERISERLICRSRPELGTRTRWVRNCLTAEQWTAYANSLEQHRRDVNERGAAGCDSRYAKDCVR